MMDYPIDDHVMVIPGWGPVSIGDGPTIATHPEDMSGPVLMEVWVDGVRLLMDRPWPEPRPVPDTPYEAYALGHWTPDRFAIRLHEDIEES